MDRLICQNEHWQAMQTHVQHCYPEEACGLIGGLSDQTQRVYLVTNQTHSSERFLMDAQEQVQAMLDMERHGWETLAIFHSHPHGPRHPSPTELLEFAYPDSLYLIWYPESDQWHCRAYRIESGRYQEIAIHIQE